MKFATLMAVIISVGFYTEWKPTPYSFPKLRFFPAMPTAANNPVTEEGVTLGRFLFYDPILSLDSTISCASCHQQAAAFSNAPLVFSKGINQIEGKRNASPLFNLAWYPKLFWDGRAASIEEQVFHPVRAHDEMNLTWAVATTRIQQSAFYLPLFKKAFNTTEIDSQLIAKAIAQFERTLLSYNSKYDQVLRNEAYFTEDELEGFILVNEMDQGDCLHCHTTDANALGTTGQFSNNGLDAITDANNYTDKGLGGITGKAKDNGKFKIPSLRNIALTAPYMHDGRFQTLEEVLEFYSEGVHFAANVDSKMGSAQHGGVHLSQEKQQQIIAFLHTLTDSSFIQNPAFSNPFLSED